MKYTILFCVVIIAMMNHPLIEASPIGWPAYQGPAVGGRALGLSGSMAGARDDPTQVYWNPAQLAMMQWSTAGISYNHDAGMFSNPVFSGPKRLNYVAMASPGAGLAWRSLARYSRDQTVADGGDSVRRYLRYGADEFALAFARRDELHPSLALGAAVKLIWARLSDIGQRFSAGAWERADLREENGIGYGLDIALAGDYTPVRLEAGIQNVLGKVYWKQFDDDRLKPRAHAGVGWVREKWPVASLGAEKYLGGGVPALRYTAGVEYKYVIQNYGGLCARAGYGNYYRGPADGYSWSWGLGYVYSKLMVDLASINQRDPLTGNWRASFAGSLSLYLN
jgi:hypothetical protein